MDHLKIFISYSHDSDAHKDRVFELSERLCAGSATIITPISRLIVW